MRGEKHRNCSQLLVENAVSGSAFRAIHQSRCSTLAARECGFLQAEIDYSTGIAHVPEDPCKSDKKMRIRVDRDWGARKIIPVPWACARPIALPDPGMVSAERERLNTG